MAFTHGQVDEVVLQARFIAAVLSRRVPVFIIKSKNFNKSGFFNRKSGFFHCKLTSRSPCCGCTPPEAGMIARRRTCSHIRNLSQNTQSEVVVEIAQADVQPQVELEAVDQQRIVDVTLYDHGLGVADVIQIRDQEDPATPARTYRLHDPYVRCALQFQIIFSTTTAASSTKTAYKQHQKAGAPPSSSSSPL